MAVSPTLRYAILERDDYRCTYCHHNDVPLVVDHYIPRTLGGSDEPANLRTACVDCNSGKGKAMPGSYAWALRSDTTGSGGQLKPAQALTADYVLQAVRSDLGRGFTLRDICQRVMTKFKYTPVQIVAALELLPDDVPDDSAGPGLLAILQSLSSAAGS